MPMLAAARSSLALLLPVFALACGSAVGPDPNAAGGVTGTGGSTTTTTVGPGGTGGAGGTGGSGAAPPACELPTTTSQDSWSLRFGGVATDVVASVALA